MSRLRRFLTLGEAGPAPAASPGAASRAVQGRFSGDALRCATPAQSVPSGGSIERFRTGRSTATIPLASESSDEQPFVRCVRCRAENHGHLLACQICGTSFDSREQREFNAEAWKEQKQRIREARERAESAVAERERSFHAEFDARQLRDAERERRSAGWGRLESIYRERTPSLGLRLVRRIRDPRLRLTFLLSLMGALTLLWSNRSTQGWAWVMAFAIAFVFLPRFPRRAR